MDNETENREQAVNAILETTTDSRVLAEKLFIARRELTFMRQALKFQEHLLKGKRIDGERKLYKILMESRNKHKG